MLGSEMDDVGHAELPNDRGTSVGGKRALGDPERAIPADGLSHADEFFAVRQCDAYRFSECAAASLVGESHSL